MSKGENPNSQAALAPHQYKRGAEWTGNRKGGRRFGGTLRDWWNALGIEDEDGVPKYTLDEIAAFADAPGDDKSVSQAKRIAARHHIEMAKGGRLGREVLSLLYDRTEGRAPLTIDFGSHLTIDPAAKITADTLAKIRLAGEGNAGQDGDFFDVVRLLESDSEPA